jgi:hypothetical protein
MVAGVLAMTVAANANSCSNVTVHGSFDRSGLQVTPYGISAAGTFRIVGEPDESKQPFFNLTTIECSKQGDGGNASGLECKVTAATVWADGDKPNTEIPNCSLDLNSSDYSMKEIQRGVFVGLGSSGMCFTSMLTLDLSKNNAFLSFSQSKEAADINKKRPGTCGAPPRTQALMNCTTYAALRRGGNSMARYCDSGGVSSK